MTMAIYTGRGRGNDASHAEHNGSDSDSASSRTRLNERKALPHIKLLLVYDDSETRDGVDRQCSIPPNRLLRRVLKDLHIAVGVTEVWIDFKTHSVRYSDAERQRRGSAQ